MGFTTPCFIRKSTYKLRKKLDELGYRLFWAELNEDLCIFTSPEYGLYNIEFFSNIPHPDETDSFDCGTNEELFLAIAALRDDTDKYQWFTDRDKWILCPEIKFSTYWVYNDVDVNLDVIHKASVDELIEHFKTKEE
mgnify:CR=1 FL=1